MNNIFDLLSKLAKNINDEHIKQVNKDFEGSEKISENGCTSVPMDKARQIAEQIAGISADAKMLGVLANKLSKDIFEFGMKLSMILDEGQN